MNSNTTSLNDSRRLAQLPVSSIAHGRSTACYTPQPARHGPRTPRRSSRTIAVLVNAWLSLQAPRSLFLPRGFDRIKVWPRHELRVSPPPVLLHRLLNY